MRTHALTFDIEDYFQVHAYHHAISPSQWESYPSTIQDNVYRILDILDRYEVRTTFFVLGWVADRHAHLIRESHKRGHEIACHGYHHQAIFLNGPRHFRDDVIRAKKNLEDIIGERVLGYRAPTYSITSGTLWALNILAEAGFVYDSSIFPIYHDYYGIPQAQKRPFFLYLGGQDLMRQIMGTEAPKPYSPEEHGTAGIVEFPLTILHLCRVNLPVAGGGYFRFYPYFFTRWALKRVEKENRPFIFYLHPWEISPKLPRVRGVALRSRLRTNINLTSTRKKLERLLKDFRFLPVKDVLGQEGLAFWETDTDTR